ncbi:MAG: FAD-dependent oxidoreductase [Monoglobaceae bacterium]
MSYRALIPKGSRHNICASRCISSDTYANSAVRVQSTCMATGQAAGCAAAIACKEESTLTDISLNKLRESLLKIGTIIPNA